jgi:prephenate dehydratase
MTKVGFLGPDGTFSSDAARLYRGNRDFELVEFETIFDVMNAVIDGKVQQAVAPLENSVEGSVTTTLDVLSQDNPVRILQEIDVSIEHCLLARSGTSMASVTDVISHMQALAQCRGFLRQNLPSANTVPARSTADAARRVASISPVVFDGQPHVFAAIASKGAAKMYGLDILKESIQDIDNNMTRFVVIGTEQLAPSGHDRTSMVCATHRDRPGSLYEILGEFARRQINLSKIESRPSKKVLGDYLFFIDLEGHISQAPVKDALDSVQSKCSYFKVIGSYPKHL